ncbi:MAG: ubiquinone/menaquinone biosynthesis C-methylase UbiE [Planctomycetota bacterium]|jgi:ubiquinone/menaquinone biosynthesis C-methylase UbiE
MTHADLRTTFDQWAQNGRAESMESSHGITIAQVLPQLDFKAGDTVLDLGCGNGWATRQIAQAAPGVQAIGIDVAPAMIARAEELHSYTIRARYDVGTFEDLEFKDAHFSRAFSMEAIYYAVDLDKALAEVHRVLKPEGRIDFVIDFYAERKGTECWKSHTGVNMHYMSIADWGAAFEKAGFANFETERVTDPAGPGDEAAFEPSEWSPTWQGRVEMHAAGSLWMRATK